MQKQSSLAMLLWPGLQTICSEFFQQHMEGAPDGALFNWQAYALGLIYTSV